MSLFPMFVKLEKRVVVIVGGGTVAEGKISGLLETGAEVRVIAPEATRKIFGWALEAKIVWLQRKFELTDLDDAFLVIAATSAQGVNEAVYQEAERRKIFCNAVDDTENCHFYYGAVVRRGDLQIAISTNGKSPSLAQRVRKELEQSYTEEYAEWLESLGIARDALRASSRNSKESKAILQAMASREMFERYIQKGKSNQKLERMN
jgi:precorrin-2 dehydrogenase/sirohydrochlorin ferrochelatase